MFFVLTKRVVKYNTGSTEKFAPRSANQESYQVSGPFTSRKAAERACVNCLATHTCLMAQVATIEQLREIRSDNHYLGQEISAVLKRFPEEVTH